MKYLRSASRARLSIAALALGLPLLVHAGCIAPPPGMVGWWPFEGNGDDIVGGNTGALVGNAGFTMGLVDQALSVNGGWLEVPDSAALAFGQALPMSFDMWLLNNVPGGVQHFIGKRNGCSGGNTEGTYQGGFNANEFMFVGNPGGFQANTDIPLPFNVWTHVAMTYDGSTMNAYIDGELHATVSGGLLGPANTVPLRIGTSGTCAGFGGLIDEVEVFDRALAAEEIQAIYEAGPDGTCKPTCSDGQLPHDECLDSDAADTSARWIGKLPDQLGNRNCPPAAGWDVQKLFAPPGNPPPPPGLAPFCLYQRAGATDDPPLQNLEALNPDSMAVTFSAPVGGPPPPVLEPLVWGPYHTQFLSQAGQPGVAPEAAPPVVRLAVVDSQLDSDAPWMAAPSESPHGFALVQMARDLVCRDDPACGVHVTSTLALPYQCTDNPLTCSRPANGGWVGTIGEVAVDIHQAVRAWRASGEDRLVVNLSLGWDPLFNESGAATRVAEQALEAAIKIAICRGALVIGAAGNIIGGPESPEGPLMPGELETQAAPTFTQCQSLLPAGDPPDPDDFPTGPAYTPLVYAVGAVKSDNALLRPRIDGTPRLVAYGDHAVGDNAGAPTSTLTGTSVSSLVTSAAAAAAWFYAPDLAPFEVMDAVYASGVDVSLAADFCLDTGGSCPEVRRASVCAAVAEVCSALPTCPPPAALNCQELRPTQPILPIDAIQAAFDGVPFVDVATLTHLDAEPECVEGSNVHSESGVTPFPCPEFEFYGIQATPWADGQPSGQNCPTCGGVYHSPGVLYIEVDDEFVGNSPDVRLVCGDDAYLVDSLEVGGLQPNHQYRVTGIPESCANGAMTLAYRVTNAANPGGTVSSTSPLVTIKSDTDSDGLPDERDNCTTKPNLDQRDTDDDGFGNVCDADLDNNCSVNFLDLGREKQVFFTNDEDADFDGDGAVNFVDLGIMQSLFFLPPGPSGIPNGCD